MITLATGLLGGGFFTAWLSRRKIAGDAASAYASASATGINATANYEAMINARITAGFEGWQLLMRGYEQRIKDLTEAMDRLRKEADEDRARAESEIDRLRMELASVQKMLKDRGETCPFRDNCDGPMQLHPVAPHLPT